jgi:hypothetical protein
MGNSTPAGKLEPWPFLAYQLQLPKQFHLLKEHARETHSPPTAGIRGGNDDSSASRCR